MESFFGKENVYGENQKKDINLVCPQQLSYSLQVKHAFTHDGVFFQENVYGEFFGKEYVYGENQKKDINLVCPQQLLYSLQVKHAFTPVNTSNCKWINGTV